MLPASLATDGSELDRIPFGPGQSPFKMKGTTYTGHIDYVKEHIPGGMAAMGARMGERYGPAHARFFEQQFLSASWYDVFPLAQAGVVCAELTGSTYREFLRTRSHAAAEGQVRGVYKWFLKLVSPEAIAQRIPKVIDTFFDFGSAEVTGHDKTHVAATFHDVPLPFAPWYATVSESYFERILEVTGTPVPELEWSIERAGDTQGVPLVRLPTIIRWPA